MSRNTKGDLQEIAALLNKRLEGFDFILVTTNPNDSKQFKYVSNLKREKGANVLFNTALQLELRDCRKLAKIEVMKKLKN